MKNSKKINFIINQLLSFYGKQIDAPASAQVHFDAALVGLLSLTEYKTDDSEFNSIIKDANEHLDFYPEIKKKIIKNV